MDNNRGSKQPRKHDDARASNKLVEHQKKSKPTTSTWDGPSTPTKKIPSSVTASTITDGRSVINYEITKTNHIFTKCHHDEPKPNVNIWIGISHTYYPHTLWCPKCNKGGSRQEYLHDDHMRFNKMIDKRNDKKDNYGPSSARNEHYQIISDPIGKRPSQAHR
jgi:hypothetical protein